MLIKDLDLWDGADGCKLIITVPKSPDLKAVADKVKTGKKMTVEIKEYREKRTLDSNAYAWVLMSKLACVLSLKKARPITADEVYRNYIKDVGVMEIVPIRDDAVTRWCEIWRGKGLGWVCETQPSKLAGYTNTVNYYGSSVYSKAEMARLIELIVADCRDLGIETMTPQELAALNERWDA